jgi:hypothetical protein
MELLGRSNRRLLVSLKSSTPYLQAILTEAEDINQSSTLAALFLNDLTTWHDYSEP